MKKSKNNNRSIIQQKQANYAYDRFTKRSNRFYQLYTSKRGCKDCGIKGPKEIYEFDHIDGSTIKSREIKDKAKGVSSYWVRNLIDLFKQIRRCDIVCANCHKIRTFKIKFSRTKQTNKLKGKRW